MLKRGAGHEEDLADGMYPAGENRYVLATGEEKFYLIKGYPSKCNICVDNKKML